MEGGEIVVEMHYMREEKEIDHIVKIVFVKGISMLSN